MKLMADGQLALLDHPRGEPSRTLRWFELSGEVPHGCYLALQLIRLKHDDPRWEMSRYVFSGEAWAPIRKLFLLPAAQAQGRKSLGKVREALRAGGCHVRFVRTRSPAGVWVVSQDARRVDTIARLGAPIVLNGGARTTGLIEHGGFVRASVRGEGVILWDATLPGLYGLIVEGRHEALPGALALLRLTKRLLSGWRGLLAGGPTATAGLSGPSGFPGPRPSGTCRSSP